MSWSKPEYGIRGRELNWLQSCIQSHDCFCGCKDPVSHLIKTALKHGGVMEFNEHKLLKLTKCQDTTTTTKEEDGTSTDQNDGPEGDLDFGDLNALFAGEDPFTDDDTG